MCRFVRLDAVALNHSRLEELIEGAPAVAARVSLTSHCITVTDPAEGETARPGICRQRAHRARSTRLYRIAMSYNRGLDRDKAREKL